MLHAMLGSNGTLKMRLGFSVSGSVVRLLQSKDTRSLRYEILFHFQYHHVHLSFVLDFLGRPG